jgi:hypothetical protein
MLDFAAKRSKSIAGIGDRPVAFLPRCQGATRTIFESRRIERVLISSSTIRTMINRSRLDSTQTQDMAAQPLLDMEQSVCLSSEISSVSDADLRATFEAGFAWMQRFIMRPHPSLGRKGAVCPFAEPAHEERAMYFCALNASGMNFDLFIEIMARLPALYRRVAGNVSGRSDLFSLCVFPTDVPAQSYYKFIDCAHAILKPFYMNTGLMLGEFHPHSSVRGARSDKIFPMRADVPLFVVRAIAAHDILFIDRKSAPIGLRIHELECYLRWAGNLLPAGEAARIGIRIETLKSQLVGNEGVGDANDFAVASVEVSG